MARRDDFKDAARRARERVGPTAREELERREERHGDLKPPEELVADASMRERELVLTTELEQAREEEAAFEDRYGMTFDEFQGAFDPQADERVTEDYLAWSRSAERVRMLRYELARLTDKRGRRARKAAPDGGDPSEPGGRRRPS